MFIKGIGIALPRNKITLTRAELSSIENFEEEAEASYYKASISDTPLSLALTAVKNALSNAEASPLKVDAIIYADSWLKDYQQWSLASALCRDLGIPDRMFLDIYQGCNLLIAMELAQNIFTGRRDFKNIIIATSKILPPKLGDHKTIDRGSFHSDGAVAVLLNKDDGEFEILSNSILYNAKLCDFVRLPYGGTEALKKSDKAMPFSQVEAKDNFWNGKEPAYDDDFFIPQRKNILMTLQLAGMHPKDISYLVMPNYCRYYNNVRLDMFKTIPLSRTSVETGMRYSHMGAADVMINLNFMLSRMKKGNLILLNQDGAGFTFGSMIIKKIG